MEIKTNFLTNAATAPAPTMAQVMVTNDPKYRRDFGRWLYQNFDELAREYKTHGRFLSLAEVQDTDSPLDLT